MFQNLEGKIEYVPYIEGNAEGKIDFFEEDPPFVITIREDKPYVRKRFSIAHEIGHLFLHLNFDTGEPRSSRYRNYVDHTFSDRYRRRDRIYQIEESEANTFAACLLMPRSKFIEVSENNLITDDPDKGPYYNLKEIAHIFGVSRQSALIRGRNLGVFSWV